MSTDSEDKPFIDYGPGYAGELMARNFPKCPLCGVAADYGTSPTGKHVRCNNCNAKFYSEEFRDSRRLTYMVLFSPPQRTLGTSLLEGKIEILRKYPIQFWDEIASHTDIERLVSVKIPQPNHLFMGYRYLASVEIAERYIPMALQIDFSQFSDHFQMENHIISVSDTEKKSLTRSLMFVPKSVGEFDVDVLLTSSIAQSRVRRTFHVRVLHNDVFERIFVINVPEIADFNRKMEFRVTVDNILEEPLNGVCVDFSDAGRYFQMSSTKMFFPTIESGTKLSLPREATPVFAGEYTFFIKVNSSLGETQRTYKIKVVHKDEKNPSQSELDQKLQNIERTKAEIRLLEELLGRLSEDFQEGIVSSEDFLRKKTSLETMILNLRERLANDEEIFRKTSPL